MNGPCRKPPCVLAPLVLLALTLALPAAGPAPRRAEPAEPPPAALATELTRLARDNPASYFELAELYAQYTTPDARRTARTLCILAAELARKQPATEGLVRSCCLLLASMADSDDERRWLIAVADGATATPKGVRWGRPPGAGVGAGADPLAYELAVALGRYRAGEFRKVREFLRKRPEAADLLARAGFDPGEAQSMIGQIISETDASLGCPRCRGERVLRSTQDNKPVVTLCPVCQGNPAPTPALTRDRFAQHMRAEAVLLDARPLSWSAQLRLDGARPLRDVDLAGVAAYYGVDPQACVRRDGGWVKP